MTKRLVVLVVALAGCSDPAVGVDAGPDAGLDARTWTDAMPEFPVGTWSAQAIAMGSCTDGMLVGGGKELIVAPDTGAEPLAVSVFPGHGMTVTGTDWSLPVYTIDAYETFPDGTSASYVFTFDIHTDKLDGMETYGTDCSLPVSGAFEHY